MEGDVEKRTSLPPATFSSPSTGMLETAVKFSGTTTVSWKRARKLGSSQQGNIRRASVASNCVPSMTFFSFVPCS